MNSVCRSRSITTFTASTAIRRTPVIIASVVPPVMYTLVNAIRKYLHVQPLIAGRDVDIGVRNCYANPREVGVDRLINAVSAMERYGKPLIIVDIGTGDHL